MTGALTPDYSMATSPLMLNRLTGWLLFGQVAYLFLCVCGNLVDRLGGGWLTTALRPLRAAVRLENSVHRLRDYVLYPEVFSSVLNVALLLAWMWMLLRRRRVPTLASDVFCLLNAAYIACSGWVLFVAWGSILRW